MAAKKSKSRRKDKGTTGPASPPAIIATPEPLRDEPVADPFLDRDEAPSAAVATPPDGPEEAPPDVAVAPAVQATTEVDVVAIRCARCWCRDLRVIYTRRMLNGSIRRLRECRHCGKRMTTTEQAGASDGGGYA
jgi:transcription repressor NrdR-like protein